MLEQIGEEFMWSAEGWLIDYGSKRRHPRARQAMRHSPTIYPHGACSVTRPVYYSPVAHPWSEIASEMRNYPGWATGLFLEDEASNPNMTTYIPRQRLEGLRRHLYADRPNGRSAPPDAFSTEYRMWCMRPLTYKPCGGGYPPPPH